MVFFDDDMSCQGGERELEIRVCCDGGDFDSDVDGQLILASCYYILVNTQYVAPLKFLSRVIVSCWFLYHVCALIHRNSHSYQISRDC